MTKEEQEKMRQGIEKQRETKLPEVVVTVMFHDGELVLGGNGSFLAREDAAPSLSCALTGDLYVTSEAPSFSALLSVGISRDLSRHRTRRRTSKYIEKFSAEKPMARSALAVLAANPNTRSPKAAATVITTMTEQRRCAAA